MKFKGHCPTKVEISQSIVVQESEIKRLHLRNKPGFLGPVVKFWLQFCRFDHLDILRVLPSMSEHHPKETVHDSVRAALHTAGLCL